MRYKIFTIWLATIFCGIGIQGYEMNMTEYFQMPGMYNFDDYDRCLQEFEDLSTYCFVRAEIIPKADSEIWRIISEISKDKRHHFDHRHLYFGICMQKCENSLHGQNADDLYAGILENNTKVNTYLKLFSSENVNRERYNRITNQCVNLHLKKYFNLSANSVVEYCTTNNDVIIQDTWNMTFYSIICLLLILVTLSSLYDLYLKNSEKDKIFTNKDHYKTNINKVAQKLCVTFSMPRNWYRLNQEPTARAGRELRFMDCLKFFSMFLVIFAHTTLVIYEAAINNPQDPERMLHTTAGTLLMGGSLITVTFFVISGFLLTLSWLEAVKGDKNLSWLQYIGLFAKFNVFRYIRLTLPYALIILASGVYFENSGGPLWRHIMEREQLSCRKNWWTNLLYINNYVNNDERCMLQSWYLAADTHSFVLSLIVLMLAHRFPKIRNKLFGFIFAVFFVLPGIFVYIKNYSPIFTPSPQTQRDSFIDSRDFTEFYAPFHMNFGSYFSGVLTAFVYHHISGTELKLHKFKAFQVLWYALFPLGVMWLLSPHFIVQGYFDDYSSIWNVIYAAMHRTSWAIGVGILIIGMSAKVGWVFRKFCCLPIFRILGRLTYGAFVMHLLVGRIAIAVLRAPIFFNTPILFAFALFMLVFSYVLSFLLAILVELPASALLKLVR